MSSLSSFLSQGRSGLFRSKATTADVLRIARASDWNVVPLTSSEGADKTSFLFSCAMAFGFPAGFGHNWDALADSLSDVEHTPGTVVVWSGSEHLPATDRATALDIFRDQVDRSATGFVVVLPSE